MRLIESRQTGTIHRILPAAIFSVYVLIHLVTLARHPFVHSDEAWLASLARTMMVEKSPEATEDVFRLTPRHPHALKTLFHLVQMPFIAVSWSVFSARLPSLLFGLAALVLFARIAEEYGLGRNLRWAATFLVGMDPQFWYAAHMGRQEMMITALFLASWYLRMRKAHPAATALPLAAAIFVHPNAFVVSLPMGALFAAEILLPQAGGKGRVKTFRDLAVFAGVLAVSALAALGLSYLMDPDFLRNYREFGESSGVGDSLWVKILGLPVFLGKMWKGSAGTYYLPDARWFMVFGTAGFFLTGLIVLFSRDNRRRSSALSLLLMIPALLSGLVIVGKYSPPSMLFLMPLAWMLFPFGISAISGERTKRGVVLLPVFLLVAGLQTSLSFREVSMSWRQRSYKSCVDFLQEHIGEDGRVLANLNTAFAFEYDRLVIWRDLEFLKDNPSALDDFLRENEVEWVVYSRELEVIYKSRPVWNNIYGNPRWYPDLMRELEAHGLRVAAGVFPEYAMRILPLKGSGDWELQVYRLQK
jgi:hypothetical protein